MTLEVKSREASVLFYLRCGGQRGSSSGACMGVSFQMGAQRDLLQVQKGEDGHGL